MRQIALKTEKILAAVDDQGIGWLTFNNPARRNALSLEMWEGIGDAFEALDADADVRVVVMKGAGGKAFVSGADISEFESRRNSAEQARDYGAQTARANRWLAQYPKPLIAMIQGYCIGGGLATALAADVRIATSGSKFGIPAARLGLGYEYGSIAKLARLVGPSAARDILFSARHLDADEALRIGLVNQVVQPQALESHVLDYAATIAGNAPMTVAACKAALNAFERGGHRDEVANVQNLVNACFDSEDYKEGRQAFMAKRTPSFRGR
jgi:enoyl-CoA hydratase